MIIYPHLKRIPKQTMKAEPTTILIDIPTAITHLTHQPTITTKMMITKTTQTIQVTHFILFLSTWT